MKENSNYSPSYKNLRSRRIVSRTNVTTTNTNSKTIITTNCSLGVNSQAVATTTSTSTSNNNTSSVSTTLEIFDDDHWREPTSPKDVDEEDPFREIDDNPFASNTSTIISSTLNDISTESSSNSTSTTTSTNSLESQLNKLSLDSKEWQLTTSNRNGSKKVGYKLSSLGYSYTIDKPKLEDVHPAS